MGLGDPWDPGREKLGSRSRGPPDPLNFVVCHNALLSLPKVSVVMTSPLPYSFSVAKAAPSLLPALRRGWEVTTWMSGPCQGDREGQRETGCFLPPPFPWACCAAFVPRLANPFPFCSACFRLRLISPPAPAPLPPQRIEMSAQDMGPICVSPACPCFALVSLPPQAYQCPPVNPLASLHGSSSCPQLLKHNWASSTSGFAATLNRGCLLQQGQEPRLLPQGGTQSPRLH